MKYFLLLLSFSFVLSSRCKAQIYYVGYNPFDCSNCNKGIEHEVDENSIYFFQKQYEVDSTNLKRKYLFSNNARVVFSDSLFKKYSLNGRSAIANKEGSLKCSSAYFTSKVNGIFRILSGQGKKTDTIIYNYPLAKRSITNYEFTRDGKVYLLDAFDNSVKLYDLFSGQMLNTLRMSKDDLKDVYTKFSMGDTSAYFYYKNGTANFTKENLSTIKDISFANDTLLVAFSNYYFFIGGKELTDTFFSHFESIGIYKDGHYVDSYIPSDIKDKLLDTSKKFLAEPSGIYLWNSDVYTSVFNAPGYNGVEKYVIGKYSPLKGNFIDGIKLSDEYNSDYNFVNPLYSREFLILAKSPEIYNLDSGTVTNTHYFKQEFLQGKIAPNYPKYLNSNIKADDLYINVLYYSTDRDGTIYFAKINRSNNKVVYNEPIPYHFGNNKIMINPYDYNSLLILYENKMIVYKMFD